MEVYADAGAACAQAYTTFFCRQNEPSYVKSLKLEILAAVADAENAHAIVTELSEYVGDIDEQLAREAVRAVGRIALDVRPHATLRRPFEMAPGWHAEGQP